jgi:hypothetical protein
MNNQFNKVDWSRFGYAQVFLGIPVLLFGLSLETDSSFTKTLIWLPLVAGLAVLLLTDRKELLKFLYPFSIKSGRGTARYLGLMGLLAYTIGSVVTADYIKANMLVNTGLLLVAASALWYMIRLTRFKERGL